MAGIDLGSYNYYDPFNYHEEMKRREEEEIDELTKVIDTKKILIDAGLKLQEEIQNQNKSVTFPYEPIELNNINPFSDKLEKYEFSTSDYSGYKINTSENINKNSNTEFTSKYNFADIIQTGDFSANQHQKETIKENEIIKNYENKDFTPSNINDSNESYYSFNNNGNKYKSTQNINFEDIKDKIELSNKPQPKETNIKAKENSKKNLDKDTTKPQFKERNSNSKISKNIGSYTNISPNSSNKYDAFDILQKLKTISDSIDK